MKQEITEKIIEWLENIGNLASNEIPMFVKEAAEYGFYSGLIRSIFLLVCIFLSVFACCFLYKKTKKITPNEMNSHIWLAFFIFIAIAVACSFGMMECFCECIKAKVSPRLYVIERFLWK